jgi:hypothetical protein
MDDRPKCVGCGSEAPSTHSNYSLISSSFGWRLVRVTLPDGSRRAEWRCPVCWRSHREGKPSAAEAPASPKRTQGPR